MEQQLYVMLLFFTYALTILSFILQKNIILRMFSAACLISASLISTGEAFWYYGFGSQNIITYTSQAGDPSRSGEVFASWLYGLFGFVQLFYTLYLAIDWGTVVIQTRNKMKHEDYR